MRACVVAVLACAGMAVVDVGAAAAASFGGAYGGFSSQGNAVTLQVSKDGRELKLARSAIDATCSDGTSDYVTDGWKELAISAKGAFSGKFADLPGTANDGRTTTTSGSLSGKINASKRSVTGRWNLEWIINQPDGSTITCKSGSVTFKLSGFGASKPKVGGSFGALTSGGGYPIVVQVAKDGRSVKAAGGIFELKCSKGGFRLVRDGWDKLPLSAAGKFKGSVTDQASKFSDDSPFTVSASVSGSIDRSGRNLKGTWRVTWKVPEPDGSTDVCDSGNQSFKVKR